MADDITIPATGSGTATPKVATDDIGGVHYQRIKVEFGVDGSHTGVDATNPLPVASKIALTPAAPASASVGVASASALPANAARKGLVLVNTSANRISLGLGAAAVLNSGITLMPTGGTWTMDEFTFTTAEIFAIASGGASGLSIQEFA